MADEDSATKDLSLAKKVSVNGTRGRRLKMQQYESVSHFFRIMRQEESNAGERAAEMP